VMAPAGPRLAVMTYNVNWGYARPGRVVAAIRRRDPDVVCVQETHLRWQLRLEGDLGKVYPHRRFLDGRGAGGMGILSKHPIVESKVLPPGSGWFPALLAEVDAPIGRVRLLNLHLKPPLSERGGVSLSAYLSVEEDHAAELEGFLRAVPAEGPPLIVTGDLNEEEDGEGMTPLLERGLVDALALYDASSVTWRWPLAMGMSLSGRYDHIFFDVGKLGCTGAVVDTVGASDHEPVTGVFVRTAPASP